MDSETRLPEAHILIIEDNPDSRIFFRVYLTQENFSVATANGAEAAFAAIRERRPDLILLDLNLPGVNGFEIAGRLQEEPDTAMIPVVVVTALTREVENDPRLATCPNIRRFIFKPCRPQALVDAVRSCLTLSRLQKK